MGLLKTLFDSSLEDLKTVVVLDTDQTLNQDQTKLTYLKYIIPKYLESDFFDETDSKIAKDGNFLDSFTPGYNYEETLEKYMNILTKNLKLILDITKQDDDTKVSGARLTDIQLTPNIVISEREYYALPETYRKKWNWITNMYNIEHKQVLVFQKGNLVENINREQADFIARVEQTPNIRLNHTEWNKLPEQIKNKYVWKYEYVGPQWDTSTYYIKGVTVEEDKRNKELAIQNKYIQIENTPGIKIHESEYNKLPQSLKDKYVWTTITQGHPRDYETYYIRGLSKQDQKRKDELDRQEYLRAIENNPETMIDKKTLDNLPTYLRDKYLWTPKSVGNQHDGYETYYVRGLTKEQERIRQETEHRNWLNRIKTTEGMEIRKMQYDNLPYDIKNAYNWTLKNPNWDEEYHLYVRGKPKK